MAASIFVLVLILTGVLQGRAINVFYVAPDPIHETCNVSESCYLLHQIDKRFLSHQSSLTLIFLSGTHVIPGILSFADIHRVDIYAYSKQSVEIKCTGLDPLIHFEDVKQLNISFVKFTSCFIVNSDTGVLDSSQGTDYAFVDDCTFYSTAISWIILYRNYVIYVNDTVFLNSTRTSRGGSISVSNVNITLNLCQFVGNAAPLGGAIYCDHSRLKILADTTFVNNSASKGGAIYLSESSAEINNTCFIDNHAQDSGGALNFDNHIDPQRSVQDQYINLVLINTVFSSNRAGRDGGAIYCGSNVKSAATRWVVIIKGFSQLNSATNGGFAYLSECHIKVHNNQESRFINNTASNGGAIYAHKSIFDFGSESLYISNTYMSGNTAEKGGALFLNRSRIPLLHPFTVIFDHNVATSESIGGEGGAIFNEDSDCQFGQCFFNYSRRTNLNEIFFEFSENIADQGSVLFGGLLDRCTPGIFEPGYPSNAVEIFKQVSEFKHSPLSISSEPLKVCMCYNSQPNCSLNDVRFAKMRGESVTVTVAALDQDKNPVASIISASFRETLSAQLKQGERNTKIFPNRCTNLNYHIFASNSTEEATLVLESSENPCRQSPLSIVTIHVTILKCSRGFEQQENMCVCDRRLTERFNISACNIDTQSVQRRGSIWFKYDEHYLKAHANCPLDYCQVTAKEISLSSPDDQCANDRSGILCGACQGNYSIGLGGSKCKDCASSYNFVWLIFVFAVAGLALVAFLLVCNITISTGTLNGLIFYANVVSTSGLTSLHNCSISPILSVFIAWVNLDLGVEACFYSGMDTYQKTWLQFAFPLYIWILVGAIIVASYYSSTAMKIFGRNNIAILATLFLLSYSKLLKTVITALSVTQVLRGSADIVSDQLVPYKVWTYDGNIEYLKGKHVALFTVALLYLIFLFLPYTMVLTFGQCVRSMPAKRRYRWILKLIRSTAFISIMDAYHAPYNRRHRYWTGLMLLTRCVQFLVFATNSTDNADVTNFFTITLVIMGVLIVKTVIGKVYTIFYIEFLELCFLLNLGITSASLYYLIGKGDSTASVCKAVTASISCSFIMFLGILVYHAFLRIRKTKYYTIIKRVFLKERTYGKTTPTISGSTDPSLLNSVNLTTMSPTITTVDLREQLLESTQ